MVSVKFSNSWYYVLSYGGLQSSPLVELTEAETEYSVNAVKHIYPQYVVLQFNCTNTIKEQLLDDVLSLTLILLPSLQSYGCLDCIL